MEVAIIFLAVFVFIITVFVSIANSNKQNNVTIRNIDQVDATCENNYNHKHKPTDPEYGQRYIVKEEPTEGYVCLNGVIRKLEDCKDL